MEEGIVREVKEYFKYKDDMVTGCRKDEIPITKEEYDRIHKEFEYDEMDPFLGGPNAFYKIYKEIRMREDTIQGIVGVLNYDRGLNKFALEHGYHPASGYPKCSGHYHNVEWRDKQIKLFGEEVDDDMPSGLARKRCKRCRK